MLLPLSTLPTFSIFTGPLTHSYQLTDQTTRATTAQVNGAAATAAGVDAEIARMHDLLRQIDELEAEFDKVRHIRDIVKGYRARVEAVRRGLKR